MRLLPSAVRCLQTTTLLMLLAANVRAQGQSSQGPPRLVPAPSPTTTKPTSSADPIDPSTKPTSPADPTDPSTKPTSPADPTDPTSKPTSPADPTDPSTKPTTASTKPTHEAPVRVQVTKSQLDSTPSSRKQEDASTQTGLVSAEAAKANVLEGMETTRGHVISPTELDRVLSDAASDLGLQVQRMSRARFGNGLNYTEWEAGLGVPVPGKVNLGAILDRSRGQWSVRVVLAMPDGTLRAIRTVVTESDYEVPVIKALRQLTADVQAPRPLVRSSPVAPAEPYLEPRSDGRAILAANGALLGGYVGFTLENAGGAAEARLVYPLIALGAGVGLASSLIVAEEWDVSRAEAWYVSAASAWLTGGAILISSELELKHATDRYSYGLIGTAAGLGLAGIVTTQKEVSDAESLFAHSGGLLGVVMGGLTQRLIEPDTDKLPQLGMGVGASAGLLIAGVGGSALLPNLTSSRVLFADLGGLLGGLAGAAVASPILVGKDPPDTREARIFVGAALGGLALGTVIGYWFGPDSTTSSHSSQLARIKPELAPVTASVPSAAFSLEPELPHATTLGLRGQW